MTDKITSTPDFRWMARRFAAVATLILVTLLVSCSGSGDSPADTLVATTPPTETAVAATSTLQPTPTPFPATPLPPPTAKADSAPTAAPTAAATVESSSPAVPQYVSEEHELASEEVFNLVAELVNDLGHREAGTAEEFHAAEHLKERLEAMGYTVELQSFTLEYFDFERFVQTQENAQVVVESPMTMQFPGLPLTTTPRGGVGSGSLVTVGLGRAKDLPEDGLAGKVVLIQSDNLVPIDPQVLLDRVNTVAAAGATAAVISVGILGLERYAPLLGAQSSIPALVLLDSSIGEQITSMLAAGEVKLTVSIETRELKSQNVVAELKGDGDGLAIVGGHYDVVPRTDAGANDNTSGIAVVLALAEAMANQSLPFSVRFIAFGAEELGLYGSSHYVASLNGEELANVRAMLNFDVVASGPLLAMTGDQRLTDLALEVAGDLGVKSDQRPLPSGASSDHEPFERVGVPVLLLYSPDVSRIHTPKDVIEFVQRERLGDAFLVAREVLTSPEFLP